MSIHNHNLNLPDGVLKKMQAEKATVSGLTKKRDDAKTKLYTVKGKKRKTKHQH